MWLIFSEELGVGLDAVFGVEPLVSADPLFNAAVHVLLALAVSCWVSLVAVTDHLQVVFLGGLAGVVEDLAVQLQDFH